MKVGNFYKVNENSNILIAKNIVEITGICRDRVYYRYVTGVVFISSCTSTSFEYCTEILSSLERELL